MTWGQGRWWGSGQLGNKPATNDAVPLTTDATSSKVVPASDTEWAAIRAAAGAPAGACTHIWQAQEASGNLADSVGTKALTAFSTPLYQQTVAGWTRKAFRLDSTADAFYSQNDTIGNTATGSALVFAIIRLTGTFPVGLPLCQFGDGLDRRQAYIGTNSALGVFGAGAQATVEGTQSMGTTVHPMWFMVNRSSQTLVAANDIEAVVATLTMPTAGAGAYFAFEGNNAAEVLYAAVFEGSAAEISVANMFAMNEVMGWPAAWSTDTLAAKPVPANTAQWNAFRAAKTLTASTPNGLWGLQDASGGAAAAIGSIALVEEGARIDYQQTIANWTRKAITSRGDAVYSSSASLADPATTSQMLLCYATIEGAGVTNDRMYIGLSNSAIMQTTAAPAVRVTHGGNIIDGAATIDTAVHPFILKFDRAAGTVVVYSDQEKISITQGVTAPNKTIAFAGSPTPGLTKFLYGAYWTGAAAELSDANVKLLLQALGWTVAW